MTTNEDARLQDLFYKTLFQTHPVRYPVMGALEPLKSLDTIALIGHYKRHYVPSRTVVVAAGDFSGGLSRWAATARATFGAATGRAEPPTLVPREPRPFSPRNLELITTAPGSRLLLGWHTSGSDEEGSDAFALEVLTALLSNSQQGLLGSQVLPAIVRVNTHHLMPAQGVSALVLSAELAGDSTDAFLAKVYGQLGKLKQGQISAEVLKGAKRQLISQLALSQMEAAAITDRVGNDYLRTGDPAFEEVFRRGVEMVSAQDIARVVDRYLLARRQTLVMQRPGKNLLEPETRPDPSPVLVEKLKNGLKVLVRPTPGAQVVSLHLFARGGLSHETPATSGLFRLLSRTLARGSAKHDEEAIRQTLTRLGAQLETSSGHHALGLSLTVVKDDLPEALALLRELVQEPALGAATITAAREELNDERKAQENDWRVMAMKTLRAHLWREHPFRLDISGAAESLKNLDTAKLREAARKHLVAGNMLAAVYGDVDTRTLLPILENSLGKLPPGPAAPLAPAAETRNEETPWPMEGPAGHVIHGLGFLSPGLAHKDLAAVSVLAAHLGGVGGVEGLLQEKLVSATPQAADMAQAEVQPALGQGALLMVFHTTPAKKKLLEKILTGELENLKTTPLAEDRLKEVKETLLALRRQGQMALPDQARAAAIDDLLGLGADYDQRVGAAISAVTSGDVERVARETLKNPVVLWVTP